MELKESDSMDESGSEMEIENEDSDTDLITEFNDQNKKRKLDPTPDEKKSKKKKSNKKDELYKQPTVEELNQLRETENLFHSNLFRVQIEEILDEVRVKQKYKDLMDSWFKKFVENVESIEDSEEFQINDRRILKENNEIPFEELSQEITGTMKFARPRTIKIIGSYSTNSMLKPEAKVDIMLEMPPTVIKKSDCENYVYFKKRAIYLAIVAAKLDKQLCEEVSYFGDLTKPMLKIKPSGKLGSKVTILVHCAVYLTKDKFKKCLPDKCNVKPEWFFKDEIQGEEDSELSTPHYNSIISHDMTMLAANDFNVQKLEGLPHVRDAIILLKIWLKQREMGRNHKNFNSHVITSYLLYLLQMKKLSTHMSSYQIVKTVWLALTQNDWTKEGFSLCEDAGTKQKIAMYKNHFPCVFLDVTGHHNIASHISSADFKYIQNIASDSLECLKDADFTSFNTLFMQKVPLYRSFEIVLCIHSKETCDKLFDSSSKQAQLDFGADKFNCTASFVAKIIEEGFGNRIDHLMVLPNKNRDWDLSAKFDFSDRIYIGLNLNREHCFSIIEKGPDAKSPEAKRFREFWGDKAELRHFKDGTIREAIVWAQGKTLSNKRYISKKILTHLIQNKLQIGVKDYFILSHDTDKFVQPPKNAVKHFLYGTGEEATLKILSTYNDLSSSLRNLKDLPLTINDTQGISPAFRYTAVFPPLGTSVRRTGSVGTNDGNYVKLKEDHIKSLPDYVAPLDLIIQFSSSGKWPDELTALRKMKAAFNLQIAASLRDQLKLKAQAHENYVDVFKDGFVFRLHIALQKEIALVKEVVEDGVTKYVDNEESIELEKKLFHLPKLNSALHGLFSNEPAFGPACCLAKRWLSSHLIDNWHFPELVIELIMASIFMKPLPYKTPNLPQVAFLRFLSLCSDNNWQLEPIIVNFNSQLSREDIVEIENVVSSSRETLPPLVICTSYDRNSIWTKSGPDSMILRRVSMLAQEALKIIETQLYSGTIINFDAIFKPPFSEYDCLIRLKDNFNPLSWQAIKSKKKNENVLFEPYKSNFKQKIPVIDFNPVQLYLKELRENYGEFALFFHDTYGGSTIAVLLKPTATEFKEFKVTNVPGRRLSKNNILTLNASALVEGFYTLGQELVKDIEFQSKKVALE